MKLTNVARASLSDELARDYASFLVQHGLRVWPKESHEARVMRARLAQDRVENLAPGRGGVVRLTGLAGLSEFVAKAEPELAANAMLCAVNQAAYLLRRQLESQGRSFLEKGGFTESLHAARTKARAAGSAATPNCPTCGQPMVRRSAKTGSRAGQSFWGCSAYPRCRGIRPLEKPSDKSDRSDTPPPSL